MPTDPTMLDIERLDELRDLDPGNTIYLDRAIANFESNSVTLFAELEAVVATGVTDDVVRVAHRLAGAALNLGVADAGALLRDVEARAGSGDLDVASALLPQVSAALERGRVALAAYQAAYQA
ncbi:Hpt domain-containing protein [Nocardioides acrostichi]|uniref:Hpt domain-containing protein n=1 Tax=Nocardioides acrostichi TaxID=2784339 RepID=A0A930V2F8_9ACTN|nr:Hpt domain-containing protein [Nocardioides acrostichi]MBF4163435.1 Hpt domain-containing protein [Nocardioides acrostichi]